MSPSGKRRVRPLDLLLVAIAATGLLLGIGSVAVGLGDAVLTDVQAYYQAGTRLNAGLPLYAQDVSVNDSPFYRYPPLLAIAFRPLALLPYPCAGLIWEGVVVASLVGLILVLRPDRFGWAVVASFALPVIWSVYIGQAQVPVTFLLAVGRPWSIALASHLKVLPALAAVWWLGRREWRSFGRFLGWTVGLGLVQLILEPSGTLAFPSVFNLGSVGEVRNWSPYAISPWLWAALVVAGMFVAWRLAPTRWGWAAAVTLSVLATPRLLLYQLMALIAGLREPAHTSRVGATAPAISPAITPATRP